MGESILELDRRTDEPVGDRIVAAWGAVGRHGRVVVVAAAAACLGLAVAWLDHAPAVVASAASLIILVGAALVDAVEHRLPNSLVAVAALPVFAALAVAGSTDLVRGAALGALLVAGPLLVTHLVSPAGMGFGDVKAGAALGAGLGLVDARVALLALVLGLAAGAVWGICRRARSIALGPALVAGALAALFIARLAGIEAGSA